MALIQTNPKRRKYGVAALVGVLGGIVSAIVKFGWEVPLPPRTPERNATNPPQQLLQQLGVPENITHLTYTFNGNSDRPYVSFIVHFAFSIAFAIIYCVLAERFPQIKLWQGAAFGIVVYVAFHVILMPLMGTVPPPLAPALRRTLLRVLRSHHLAVGHRSLPSRPAQPHHTRTRRRVPTRSAHQLTTPTPTNTRVGPGTHGSGAHPNQLSAQARAPHCSHRRDHPPRVHARRAQASFSERRDDRTVRPGLLNVLLDLIGVQELFKLRNGLSLIRTVLPHQDVHGRVVHG